MTEQIRARFGEYLISSDKSLLQHGMIYDFISRSYWAKDIPFDIFKTSIENSYCIGVYHGAQQVGFARIVTDYATYGYLADVFILEEHRGKGLSKYLMQCIMLLGFVKNFRRFSLGTRDAHGLYAQFGFTSLNAPDRMMEIHQPDIYQQLKK